MPRHAVLCGLPVFSKDFVLSLGGIRPYPVFIRIDFKSTANSQGIFSAKPSGFRLMYVCFVA